MSYQKILDKTKVTNRPANHMLFKKIRHLLGICPKQLGGYSCAGWDNFKECE